MVGIRTFKRGSHNYDTVRVTAAGSAVTGRCLIWWIMLHPKESDWELGMSDGTATGTTLWTVGYASPPMLNFDPPLECLTGFYIEKLDHINSATICYSTV